MPSLELEGYNFLRDFCHFTANSNSELVISGLPAANLSHSRPASKMEGSPKCDLCVFITKAMQRCVEALEKFYSQTECAAFTSDISSFRADKGPTFKGKQGHCQSNIHFMLLFYISIHFRLPESLALYIFINSPGEVLGNVTSYGLKYFNISFSHYSDSANF